MIYILNSKTSKETLYKYRKYELVKDTKMECNSLKGLNELFISNKLTIADVYIFNTLYNFKYLNRYSLEMCLLTDENINPEFKKTSYKNRLSQLCSYGLIKRHYLKYIDEVTGESKRTPYIYSLTRASTLYIKLNNEVPLNIEEYILTDKTERILKCIVTNQTLISFAHNSNNNYDIHTRINVTSVVHKKKLLLYGILNIYVNTAKVSFIIEPVRKESMWEQDILNRYMLIKSISNEKSYPNLFVSSPVVIYLCEDDTHIKEICEFLCTKKLNINSIYFTTDVRMLTNELCNSLLSCCLDDEYNLTITRTPLKLWS